MDEIRRKHCEFKGGRLNEMPPQIIDKCATCYAPIYVGKSAVYDERTNQYFCDRQCFRDWADDNFDEVCEFYESMNVKDECL